MKNRNFYIILSVIIIGVIYHIFLISYFYNIKLLLFSLITYFTIILIFYRSTQKAVNQYMKFISSFNDSLSYLINRDYKKLNELQTLHETFDSKVNKKIIRLWEIWQDESLRGIKEKKNLQSLISDVSHQVKTPMTNLKMLQTALENERISKEHKDQLLKSMEGQLDKIGFLLESMIKSSRLETGLIQLNKTSYNLFDTIVEAISGITVKAARKNIEILVSCPENYILPHDKKWTAEALFNILENAIKYSPENTKMEIKVYRWEMYTKIDVLDEGIGISEEYFGKIFQRFFRGENGCDEEGVGIGLYLSREIIQRQGGYIKVSSTLGEGSTFSIFLPNEL
jgi:signal transduction histidine kinase